MESVKELSEKERKVCLVTGTSGFIGRRVANQLKALGHDVYGLERYVAGRTIYGAKQFKTVFADLNDHWGIKNMVHEIKPQAVFHIGALSPVAYSYNHPLDVNATNYLASINLAETCMRENSLEHFLWAGTSEEYGNQETVPISETAVLKPNSPYACSKVAFDVYLQYLFETYDFPGTIIRPFNTYGRMGDAHFLVESIITQMKQSKVLNLGMQEPVRDLMYVSDHVSAYITCFQKRKCCLQTAINFCTQVGWTMSELVEEIADLLNWRGQVNWGTIPKRPNDIITLIGCNNKAKALLGWEPKVPLREGLKKTISQLTSGMEAS